MRERARRGVYYKKDIKAGSIINLEDIHIVDPRIIYLLRCIQDR